MCVNFTPIRVTAPNVTGPTQPAPSGIRTCIFNMGGGCDIKDPKDQHSCFLCISWFRSLYSLKHLLTFLVWRREAPFISRPVFQSSALLPQERERSESQIHSAGTSHQETLAAPASPSSQMICLAFTTASTACPDVCH